jgi:cobalt-zinc-cadmium efflux system protein
MSHHHGCDHHHDGHLHGHGGHDHSAHTHGHEHAPKDFGRAFALGTALNLGFVLIEAAYGIFANSMALLADAGHNLSDVFGLIVAWGAATLVKREPSHTFTYGLGSSSILAALANAVVLLIAVGAIVWEAVQRFWAPEVVNASTIIWVAAIGIVINGFTAWLFASGSKDINVRGAFLHMAADTMISLGVVITGLAIIATGWLWLDPAISIAIAAVIVWGTWGLLKESARMALHGVPNGIDPGEVRVALASLPGVASLHDLHIWPISTTSTALTCHLVMPDGHPGDAFIAAASELLAEKFAIQHTTLQIERGDAAVCKLAPDHVV